MRHVLAWAIVAVSIAGCASTPTPGLSSAAVDAAEVKRPVDQFAETWNRHDMRAFADLFASDAQFVNVVGLWWKGREEIFRAHQFSHSNMFKASRLTLVDTV